jgi:hypothetical protein
MNSVPHLACGEPLHAIGRTYHHQKGVRMINFWVCNECSGEPCTLVTISTRFYQSDRCPASFRGHESKWVRLEAKEPAPNSQQQLKQAIANAKEAIDIVSQRACI